MRLPFGESRGTTGAKFAGLVLCTWLVGILQTARAQDPPQLRMCKPQEKKPAQPFSLPSLRLQWDSWTTSQMTTSVAAIILSEYLGFDVEFVPGASPAAVYSSLATGDLHLAFESWPESNADVFARFTGANASSQVQAVAYSNLFGRSGAFLTLFLLCGLR
jgi:ABC-type proline/glycine betaine transport system substrate-binding protein